MTINKLVNITKLKKECDIGAALNKGNIFQYEKRGYINYVFHNGEPMRYLTYLEFAPNKYRGNHYHNKKEENLLVLKGNIKAKYWLLDNNDVLELMLEPGDIVNVKPGVAHVYISENGASAIEYSPQILDYNDQIKIK